MRRQSITHSLTIFERSSFVRSFVRSFVSLVGWLVGWFVGSLVGWLVGSSVRGLVGSLARWLVGSLVGWFCAVLLHGHAPSASSFQTARSCNCIFSVCRVRGPVGSRNCGVADATLIMSAGVNNCLQFLVSVSQSRQNTFILHLAG